MSNARNERCGTALMSSHVVGPASAQLTDVQRAPASGMSWKPPLVFEYRPVRYEVRLGEHSEFVTNASVKRIPSLAMRSMFGVLRTG